MLSQVIIMEESEYRRDLATGRRIIEEGQTPIKKPVDKPLDSNFESMLRSHLTQPVSDAAKRPPIVKRSDEAFKQVLP